MSDPQSTTKPRILLVDDEPQNLKALERTLRAGFDTIATPSPEEALKIARGEEFSVVISDQRMPGMLGTDLLQRISALHPLTTRVILTAHTETKEILDAINRAEIYRYITKPWDNQELVATIRQAAERSLLLRNNRDLIRELEEKNKRLVTKEEELVRLNQSLEAQVEHRTAELKAANEKLSELAMTDPLTGVLNRRAFFNRFHDEIQRSQRYKHAVVVVMIDVDHFKTFNDMEGHVFGDEALRKITQLLASSLRRTDVLARYGGEEFIVMMPETNVANALEICERLRNVVEVTTFQGKKAAAYLTISLGLACYPGDGETSEALVEAADSALYQAKEAGRNRVVRKSNASFLVS